MYKVYQVALWGTAQTGPVNVSYGSVAAVGEWQLSTQSRRSLLAAYGPMPSVAYWRVPKGCGVSMNMFLFMGYEGCVERA